MALGGVVAALAVLGGGTLVAINAPADVEAGDILLAQNEVQAAAQEMPLGEAVHLDLEPVVARAAGGTIPDGTAVQVTGLPDGLSQDGWVISGVPTRAGQYDVLVTVSNSGASRSQKVAIVVTDEAGVAVPPSATSGAPTDSEPSTEDDSPAVSEESEASGPLETSEPSGDPGPSAEIEPTLSASPGDRVRAAESGTGADPDVGDEAGVEDGAEIESDDEVGVNTELCAALEGGQSDAASLEQLAPPADGNADASTGLVVLLVNTVIGLLPSVMGEGGSLEDLGSAGEILCTLSPSLLGGQGDGPVEGGAGAAVAAAADLMSGTQVEGRGAAEALTAAPALLGLVATGAGSLGG